MKKILKKNSFLRMAYRTQTKKELYETLPVFPITICNVIHEYVGNPFIFTLRISIKKTVSIPTIGSMAGFFIEWGDKDVDTYDSEYQTNIAHTYKTKGRYIVHIYGVITKINFRQEQRLIEISQWGNVSFLSGYKSFHLCKNLLLNTRDSPDLKFCRDLSFMFSGCESLASRVSEWDVSTITNMNSMFEGCKLFTSDLRKWNVKNVSNMCTMFSGCTSFNSDISKWNTTNVTIMSKMFNQCVLFNSNIGGWNVKNALYMNEMFSGCVKFSANLDEWNIWDAIYMDKMFYGCKSYKINLRKWRGRKVF